MFLAALVPRLTRFACRAQIFNLGDGVSLTFNPAPGSVAPSLTVSSIMVLTNAAPGAVSCGLAVFLDAAPAVNGVAYAPLAAVAAAGRRMLLQAAPGAYASFAPGAVSTLVATIDATGRPVSITNAAGVPFLAIPFPAGGASNCVPVTVAANSSVVVGGGSAVAMAFPGTILSFEIK